jgi:hypothetical protein
MGKLDSGLVWPLSRFKKDRPLQLDDGVKF